MKIRPIIIPTTITIVFLGGPLDVGALVGATRIVCEEDTRGWLDGLWEVETIDKIIKNNYKQVKC